MIRKYHNEVVVGAGNRMGPIEGGKWSGFDFRGSAGSFFFFFLGVKSGPNGTSQSVFLLESGVVIQSYCWCKGLWSWLRYGMELMFVRLRQNGPAVTPLIKTGTIGCKIILSLGIVGLGINPFTLGMLTKD